MIKMITTVPHEITIAFSGGVDSLAIAHFLKAGKRKITLAHFNHGCPVSDKIEQGCRELADQLQLPIIVKRIDDPVVPSGSSVEDYWRRNRYRWLRLLDCRVLTGHHLDDAMETWLWSAIHGDPKLIPVESGNILRPFLTTPKREFEAYCKRHKLTAIHDECNDDLSLTRNYMRANLMPVVENINPGFEKVIRKKYLQTNLNKRLEEVCTIF